MVIKKFELILNNLGYDLCPEPEDEIEQILKINDKGQVRLSRYCYGVHGKKYPLIGKEVFCIPTADANYILRAVTEFFESDYKTHYVTDFGDWNLKLTNYESEELRISGPLCKDLLVEEGGLSDIIRSKLRRNDLLAFDGNPGDH